MKKKPPFIFYRYVLKEHIGPFLFALSLIVFLFLMNYTLREVHRLFGRGLDTIIILRMYYYALAPILALAIPMSVLVATAMASVRLAADSEITILRSSGVSLVRILQPIIIASVFIAIGMYYFNNTILPDYNVQSSKLRMEISRVKPTSTLYPKTFTQIKGVKLYVENIDDTFNEKPEKKVSMLGEYYRNIPVDHLFDVIIYDDRKPEASQTIIAEEGFLLLNQETEKFEFILFKGEIHEVAYAEKKDYTHSFFTQMTFFINASDFVFRDDRDEYKRSKSNRQKSVTELQASLVKEHINLENRIKRHANAFEQKRISLFTGTAIDKKFTKQQEQQANPQKAITVVDSKAKFKTKIYKPFSNLIKSEERASESVIRMNRSTMREIRDLEGEFHKKFAIPIASIIFVLIGAPLGMLTRKGEAGAVAVVYLIVFIIYYICLILGEDWSENGKIAPWLGLWAGNIFGGSLGLLFLYLLSIEKSIVDSKFFKLFSKKGN